MKRPARALRFLLLALALVLPLCTVGCQVFGLGAYLLNPPKQKALYQPPKTPMCIVVENRANPGMFVFASDQLSGYIADDLTAYEVCPLIPQDKLHQLQDARPDMDKMTISQIGKALGASQVLYVDIQRINIGSIQGVPASARAEARVHVVDVQTGKTLFPSTDAGYPIVFDSPLAESVNSPSTAMARETMLRTAGTNIARLFHDYMPG